MRRWRRGGGGEASKHGDAQDWDRVLLWELARSKKEDVEIAGQLLKVSSIGGGIAVLLRMFCLLYL